MNDRQRLTQDGKMIVHNESVAIINRVRQGVTEETPKGGNSC